jgi:hypothetical protein
MPLTREEARPGLQSYIRWYSQLAHHPQDTALHDLLQVCRLAARA